MSMLNCVTALEIFDIENNFKAMQELETSPRQDTIRHSSVY